MEHQKSNIDEEYLENKLKDYIQISHTTLKKGHHLRYCKNRYKQQGRDCCYAVVKEVLENGKLMVNGYAPDGKNMYPDWCIEPTHKFKCFTFYRKKDDVEKESLYRDSDECDVCGNDEEVHLVKCQV